MGGHSESDRERERERERDVCVPTKGGDVAHVGKVWLLGLAIEERAVCGNQEKLSGRGSSLRARMRRNVFLAGGIVGGIRGFKPLGCRSRGRL